MIIRYSVIGLISIGFSTQAFAQSNTEASLELSGLYNSEVTINDDNSTVTLDDVYGAQIGVRTEKILSQSDNSDLLLAISLNGAKGQGTVSDFSPSANTITGEEADFYRIEGFADIVKQKDGAFVSPFLSAGVGLQYEKVNTDTSKFESLSPAARFRAGVEKDVSDKLSFGVSAGPSIKLD